MVAMHRKAPPTGTLCMFQALKLIFNSFRTHDVNDPLTIWDVSGTELYSVLYGIQTGRPDIIIHDSGGYISFTTNGGGQTTGFDIEYQCYTLTETGKRQEFDSEALLGDIMLPAPFNVLLHAPCSLTLFSPSLFFGHYHCYSFIHLCALLIFSFAP